MRCKQAEKLIIDASQVSLDPKIKSELDEHVLNCPKCASFNKNLMKIHREISELTAPKPSPEILEKTRILCHDELIGRGEIYVFEKYLPKAISIPKFVWIAFGMLAILTGTWAVPVFKDVVNSQIMTRQAVLIITIIVQNLIMLLFSPVLLRSLKLTSKWFNYYGEATP